MWKSIPIPVNGNNKTIDTCWGGLIAMFGEVARTVSSFLFLDLLGFFGLASTFWAMKSPGILLCCFREGALELVGKALVGICAVVEHLVSTALTGGAGTYDSGITSLKSFCAQVEDCKRFHKILSVFLICGEIPAPLQVPFWSPFRWEWEST